MNKLFLFIFFTCVLSSLSVKAQISDADAKLLYQQAEESYNRNKYFDASQQVWQLAKKMNDRWAPKTLYLYLKSAYMSYINTDNNSGSYRKEYNSFNAFYNECNTFFQIIDKPTYPSEKYREIVDIQAWFKIQMDVYAYQKNRKPQDAVDFLNECAKLFRKKTSLALYKNHGGYSESTLTEREYEINYQNAIQNVQFELRNSDLLIFYPRIFCNYGIDRINMSNVTQLNLDGNSLKVLGKKSYDAANNQQENYWFISYYETRSIKEYDGILKGKGTFREDYNMRFKNDSSKAINTPENVNERYASDFRYDFLRFFDTSSDKFRQENYAKRIQEALQYLIDSAPKKKEEENINQSKNKF